MATFLWVLRIGIWISLGTIIVPATPWLPTHSFTVPHPVCDYMISSIFFLLYSLSPLLFYAFMLLCGLIPFLSCSLFLFHIFLCNPHYLAFGSCFELLFIILFFSLELNLFNHFPLSSLELCFFFFNPALTNVFFCLFPASPFNPRSHPELLSLQADIV